MLIIDVGRKEEENQLYYEKLINLIDGCKE